jgi:hypothetical protein
MNPKDLRTLRLVAAAACLLAPLPWPYGYFQLLRWLVSIAAGVSAWDEYGRGRAAGGWTFVAVAVLFNPLAPIHMDRETWVLVDIVTGVLLGASALRRPKAAS